MHERDPGQGSSLPAMHRTDRKRRGWGDRKQRPQRRLTGPGQSALGEQVATQSWSAPGGQTALTSATLLFVKGVDLLAVRQAGAVVERELSYTPGTRLARR